MMAGFSGVAFAVIPSVTILSSWAFVDIATVAYFLAVVYLGALVFVKTKPPSAWLLGLMAAGAIGTKYSMIPLMGLVAIYLGALLFFAQLVVIGLAIRGEHHPVAVRRQAIDFLFRSRRSILAPPLSR